MDLGKQTQFNSLKWVKDELKLLVKDIQSLFGEYLEVDSDLQKLDESYELLSQIKGTMLLVQVQTGAMLSEEIAELVLSLKNGQVQNKDDAQELVLRGILTLNELIESADAKAQTPVAYLPLLNDFRAVRNESLLSGGLMFLSEDVAEIPQLKGDDESQLVARKVRPLFQIGLLHWFRNENDHSALERMGQALDDIKRVSSLRRPYRFWQSSSALVDVIKREGVEINTTTKLLLGKVDREIKQLIDTSPAQFDELIKPELFKNLLYYLSISSVDTEATQELENAFGLKQFSSGADSGSEAQVGHDDELLKAVSIAIKEDIQQVKDLIEINGENLSEAQSEELLNMLSKITDTIGMLGLGSTRNQLINVSKSLQEHAPNFNEEQLMFVAKSLIMVESALDGMGQRVQIGDQAAEDSEGVIDNRKVVAAVAQETGKTLTKVKELINEFVNSDSDISVLASVPGLLDQVSGAMFIDALEPIKSVIGHISQYVQLTTLNQRQLSSDEQDALADAITSVEFFIEAVSENRLDKDVYLVVGNEATERLTLEGLPENLGESGSDLSLGNQSSTDVEVLEPDVMPLASDEIKPKVNSVDHPTHAIPKADDDVKTMTIIADDVDEEILEIFIEEALEEQARLLELFPKWKASPDDNELLTTIRRSFHTLKGSGRLLGAELIGEFGWSLENMLNRLIDESIQLSPALFDAVEESTSILPQLIEQLTGNKEQIDSAYTLIAKASAIAEGETDIAIEASQLNEPAVDDSLDSTDLSSEALLELDEDSIEFSVEEVDSVKKSEAEAGDDAPSVVSANAEYELPEMDSTLAGIYSKECYQHIQTIHSQLNSSGSDLHNNHELTRALHTLHGSSRIAGIHVIADVARKLEYYGNDRETLGLPWEGEMKEHLSEAIGQFSQLLDTLKGESSYLPDLPSLLQSIEPYAEIAKNNAEKESCESVVQGDLAPPLQDATQSVDLDDELVAIFLEEAQELVDACDVSLQSAIDNDFDTDSVDQLKREMHTLKGGARMAELLPIGDVSHALEETLEYLEKDKSLIDLRRIAILRDAVDVMSSMLEEISEKAQLTTANQVLRDLRSVQGGESLTESNNELDSKILHAVPESEADDVSIVSAVGSEIAHIDQDDQGVLQVDLSDELVDIFLEEAEEIVSDCDKFLHEWERHNFDKENGEAIQRLLHTLKGGARMANLSPIGDLSHEMEDTVLAVEKGSMDIPLGLTDTLKGALDQIAGMLEQIKTEGAVNSAEQTISLLARMRSGALDGVEDVFQAEPQEQTQLDSHSSTEESAKVENTRPVINDVPVAMQNVGEQIRVRSDTLDSLVNNAGEVNVYHSRFQQQLSSFNFNLEELEQTVDRIREQVRQVSIETDAQIDSRVQRETDNPDENFDPLEMDRYSHMQQLARSLMESVNDLEELQGSMDNMVRDSETILVQQQRITSDLQEGLMSTRMVRFDGLTTRLRRIVRQTSQELNKKVDIEFNGMNQEIDRTVQERMLAPLEHMIRNSISHGIEESAMRKKKGKSDTGLIELNVVRDGSYIVLTLKDDGAGIDVQKVKQKALDKGLIKATDKISDQEVIQYILHSGFSTAEQVTQIAGRGVGMDVVSSEIKHLGGSLRIDSKKDEGTTFVVRLPLTLAINQALMVVAKDNIYAIPLTTIEGIARVDAQELSALYAEESAKYQYAGDEYELYYLPSLIRTGRVNELDESIQYPVLLIQAGDRRVAIHVDELLGRREIVVKAVGRQVSTLPGVSGATILDDGRVALILEMTGLVEQRQVIVLDEGDFQDAQIEEQVEHKKPVVMVVDDSITIRKVTTRFLERNQYEVITAKDGLDAVEQLQDVKPDIMLLDIEMPRMDGYEVASHVRNTEELAALPIIMITSRTGDKHRQRAMEIGVNQYLGKPFQEEQLLSEIGEVLAVKGAES